MIARAVVERLLFCGETNLTDKVRGSLIHAQDRSNMLAILSETHPDF